MCVECDGLQCLHVRAYQIQNNDQSNNQQNGYHNWHHYGPPRHGFSRGNHIRVSEYQVSLKENKR